MADELTAPAPPVIVDASVAIEALAGNEQWTTTLADWARSGRMRLAPPLLMAEVANGQLRGQRLPAHLVALQMERLAASGIETADRGLAGVLESIDLAHRHGLTVYDALYLQLALDVEGELATLDQDLIAAARAEGLEVVAA